MNSARIREATVARRYHVTSRGATSAAAALATAPSTTADTGTAQFRAAPTQATAAIGTSQSAAAAAWREDQRRGSRQRASASTHSERSGPEHCRVAEQNAGERREARQRPGMQGEVPQVHACRIDAPPEVRLRRLTSSAARQKPQAS